MPKHYLYVDGLLSVLFCCVSVCVCVCSYLTHAAAIKTHIAVTLKMENRPQSVSLVDSTKSRCNESAFVNQAKLCVTPVSL